MKTLVVLSNEPGLRSFRKGWTSKSPAEGKPGFFRVVVNREQYEAMEGSEHDPWDPDGGEDQDEPPL